MITYTLNGGYCYSGGIDIECDSIMEAAAQWFDRWSSNGHRMVAGYLWPCFGDMADDDYAVVNYATDETMTRAEIMAEFQLDW